MKRRARTTVGLVFVAASAGCVSGEWRRTATDEPFAIERVEALRPGADTLATCLTTLGAPMSVREHARGADGASGMALVWVWRDASGFGIDVSSGRDEMPGSFEFDRDDVELPACVLWFDRDLVLQRWRIGTVGELLSPRSRPAAPEVEP